MFSGVWCLVGLVFSGVRCLVGSVFSGIRCLVGSVFRRVPVPSQGHYSFHSFPVVD